MPIGKKECQGEHADALPLAKYTCPGCGFLSCSLECSKAHKAPKADGTGGCSGRRDRTAFVSLRTMEEGQGEAVLQSDYGFLEEVQVRLATCRLRQPRR